MLAGNHLAQGILACLLRKTISGEGSLVQVSMLESAIDFQFELLLPIITMQTARTIRK